MVPAAPWTREEPLRPNPYCVPLRAGGRVDLPASAAHDNGCFDYAGDAGDGGCCYYFDWNVAAYERSHWYWLCSYSFDCCWRTTTAAAAAVVVVAAIAAIAVDDSTTCCANDDAD